MKFTKFARLFIFSFVISIASYAHGAISILDAIQTFNADSVPSITQSFTISAGSNRLLLLFLGVEDDTDIAGRISITYNGQALTEAVNALTPAAGGNYAGIWYLLDASLPASGAFDVVITYSVANVSDTIWGVMTLQGVSQGAPKTTDTFYSASDNSNEITLTGIDATDWSFDFAVSGNNTSQAWSQNAGQTELAEMNGGPATVGVGGAASYDPGGTAMAETLAESAFRFCHVAAAWAEAGGGGGETRRRLTVFGVGP